MALRHLLLRLPPRLDRRWVFGALILGALALAASFIRWSAPPPPLALLALGPDGRFGDTVALPVDWGDTATLTPDAVTRLPVLLGARNLGDRPAAPARLSLSLPLRYRLTRGGRALPGRSEAGSPLITYTLDPGVGRLEPERLPTMIGGDDTLWVEVVIPSVYCVSVGDSIPDFVPAYAPPIATLQTLEIFYSFEGGDLNERRTGTLVLGIDTTLLVRPPPPQPPSFPMVTDPALAQPELGALRRVGSRRSSCGEPESPMQLLSTVWETPAGGRFITLDYGGTVRKRLYDLDGDGVIERESWAPDGRTFTATRRARLPIPEFLLPVVPPDTARADSVARDSLGRPRPARRDTATPRDSLPEPRIDRPGVLGQPVEVAPLPPDTGG